MSQKFNAKRFPVEAGNRSVYYVDDLCRIEEAGPTLRLLFAQVNSQQIGRGDWRRYREAVVELIIPIEQRLLLAQELLNFNGVPTTEEQPESPMRMKRFC